MKQAARLVLWQLLVTVVMAVTMLFVGRVVAYSALLGGLICVIPNAYLATRLLLVAGEAAGTEDEQGNSQRFLRAAFTGEAVKLLITGVLFALVFVNVGPLNVPVLFGAYIITLGVNWVALIGLK